MGAAFIFYMCMFCKLFNFCGCILWILYMICSDQMRDSRVYLLCPTWVWNMRLKLLCKKRYQYVLWRKIKVEQGESPWITHCFIRLTLLVTYYPCHLYIHNDKLYNLLYTFFSRHKCVTIFFIYISKVRIFQDLYKRHDTIVQHIRANVQKLKLIYSDIYW